MQAVVSPARSAAFQLADPLDWFQLRALLWEFVENPCAEWSAAPAFLTERCPRSKSVDSESCRRAYENIRNAFPGSGSSHRSGPELWTQLLYTSVHRLFPQTPIFMNLGYAGEIPGLRLAPEDEPLYPFIALYRCAVEGIPIAGRDVTDIGCGVGGGCWHLLQYLEPRSVTGVDMVEANIAAAQRVFQDRRLRFVQGDAERLPLSDQSADVVVSVESSHSYRSFSAFLTEVRRVLRPGGLFALADHRPLRPEWGEGRTVSSLLADVEGSMVLLRQREITSGVVASCEMMAGFKEQMLADASLSEADRRHLREILHCRDSENHRKLCEGQWSYRCHIIQKPA
jgi:ubiquinone/menaquinone biosynthesis C-methylase UbiE